MKKLLLVVSILSFVTAQAANDPNDDPDDNPIEITLINGKKCIETRRQLELKHGNMRMLVQMGCDISTHDKNHMIAILSSVEKDKQDNFFALVKDLYLKKPVASNGITIEPKKEIALKNYKYLLECKPGFKDKPDNE